MQKEFRRAFGGGGNQEKVRVACLFDDLVAKFVKDVRTIRRKDDKFVSGKDAISCHSEALQSRKNPAYLLYNTSKLKGICMNNLTETDHASMPLGIFASKYDVGIAMPTYFAVYPSKSSLTREDLSFGKIVHYNNFDLTETVHSPFTTHNSLKKSAFTLAEVLITLGIIGVVAALTLPSLIQRNIEKQRVAQLKKAYSELSQAYNLAIAENGSPTEWGMGGMYEEKSHYIMADNMRKFLKLSVDCVDMTAEQTRVNCGHDNLYSDNPYRYNKDTRRLVVLSDGTLVNIRTYTGLCNFQFGAIKNVCGVISVDLNGATPPNRNGEDMFDIFITRDNLVPEGIDGASHAFEIACNKSIKNPYPSYGGGSMFACTAWVLYNENMDYLHCDDLSWGGKHSCKEK